MKHIWTVIRGNIRRNKGAYIGIILLMFVVSVSFVTVYNVASGSKKRQDEALKESGYGDYWATLSMEELLNIDGTSTDEIIKKLEASPLIDHVTHFPAYGVSLETEDYATDWDYLIDIDNGYLTYRYFDENNHEMMLYK